MRLDHWIMVAATGLAIAPYPCMAAETTRVRTPTLARLLECQTAADDVSRLACYDERVRQLDQAERNEDVVVVDRTQIRKARRSLFGLTLPDVSIFGNRDERGAVDVEGVSKIESTIRSASQNANGRWIITLQDGARWIQVDTRNVAPPRVGMPIVIRKAAMGSFLVNIDRQIAIRMTRLN